MQSMKPWITKTFHGCSTKYIMSSCIQLFEYLFLKHQEILEKLPYSFTCSHIIDFQSNKIQLTFFRNVYTNNDSEYDPRLLAAL